MRNILSLIILLSTLVSVHAAEFSGKKVLHINSYHQGYAWSDGIEDGVKKILLSKGVELKFHRMNTKHNASPEFLKAAGLKAKADIDAFQPDVVIVADDNATQYVLMTHYRNASLPFVFCGVNWEAAGYGLPYSNTTGILEVGLEKGAIKYLGKYAQGQRVGLLASNTITNRRNHQYHTEKLGIHYHQTHLVDNFSAWKAAFLALQNDADLIIMPEYASMADWNQQEAEAFVLKHTRIPAAAMQEEIAHLALIGVTKSPTEQGIWAARAVLKILAGTAPNDIAMAKNKINHVRRNQVLAQHLGIQFGEL